MGPPSYIRSVVDRNVVMRPILVLSILDTNSKPCVIQASAATYLRIALLYVITQRVVVISYRRFGTTYWYHPHVSRSRTIIMVPIGYAETLVRYYHHSPRNNPEERSSQIARCL